ncbi:hypothetical protein MMC13_003424 [Lambiella insularis]|nr:hypothetical protein [Lambiella insularis]
MNAAIDPALLSDDESVLAQSQQIGDDITSQFTSTSSSRAHTPISMKRNGAQTTGSQRARKRPKTGFDRLIETMERLQEDQNSVKQDPVEVANARAIKTLQEVYIDLQGDDFVRAVAIIEGHTHTFNHLDGERRDIWLQAMLNR